MKLIDYLGGSQGHTISALAIFAAATGLLLSHHIAEGTWQQTTVWVFGTYGLGGAVSAYRDSFTKPAA